MNGLGVFQVFYPDHAGNGGTSSPPVKAAHSGRGSPLLRKPYQENLSVPSILTLEIALRADDDTARIRANCEQLRLW
jgi:hypothetical protein